MNLHTVESVYTKNKEYFIRITGGDCDGDVWLTPEQAMEMASNLKHVVWMIEQKQKLRQEKANETSNQQS